MADPNERKLYRIGDYARYMGVTPDFLKHYEENGLLAVHYTSSGYRYYDFDQSSRILEYMRLRNYGVNVRDMNRMLCAEDNEALRLLDEKAESLRAEVRRIEAVLAEHERVKVWYERRLQRPVDWEVRDVEPCWFLPHANARDFERDERVYPLLKQWVEWMPVVKSALRVTPSPGENPYTTQWGLILRSSLARQFGIPLGEPLVAMPGGKAFVYHFVGLEREFSIDEIARGHHPMFEQMEKLGLRAAKDAYLVVEMKLTKADGNRRGGSGRFIVPLAD